VDENLEKQYLLTICDENIFQRFCASPQFFISDGLSQGFVCREWPFQKKLSEHEDDVWTDKPYSSASTFLHYLMQSPPHTITKEERNSWRKRGEQEEKKSKDGEEDEEEGEQ